MRTAQLAYALDVLAAKVGRDRCPNCGSARGERVARKSWGLANVYRCRGCALLYRPSALQGSTAARLYYSYVYRQPGITTDVSSASREQVVAEARSAGKDRVAFLRPACAALGSRAANIGVFGASWGYELLCLEALGLPVYGIEPGSVRRAHGRSAFGLDLHESPRAAGRREGALMSSHVLEHIVGLDQALDDIARWVAPTLQLHFTPRVDPFDDALRSSIGREHPLGVTADFWRRRAARRGEPVRTFTVRPSPDEPECELLAIVGAAGTDELVARYSLPAELGTEMLDGSRPSVRSSSAR